MKKLDEFLLKISNSGIKYTILDSFLPDVGEYRKRKVPAILYPKSISEIKTITHWASTYLIHLYPYSKGKNWGFGSRVPIKNNSILVELSSLNKIRALDIENRTIILEPGVTQQKLSKFLKDKNFIANLTSSSPLSSVLGNTLDNGIGYLGRKIDDMVGLEMISGNGTLHQFGYLAHDKDTENLLHCVPQTGLGIVTAIAIKLYIKPTHFILIQLLFEIEELNKIVAILKSVYKQGLIKGTSKMAQWESNKYQIVIPIFGKKSIDKINSLRKEISTLNINRVWDAKNIKLLDKRDEMVVHWDIYNGIPNPIPTSSYIPFGHKEENLDVFSNTGIKLLAHIIPLNSIAIQKIDYLIKSIPHKPWAQVTFRLNILDDNHSALVIYVHFMRNKQGIQAGKKISEYLFMALLEYGFKPYRLHIDLQEILLKNSPQPKRYQSLKHKFDPLHIIAQGRYGLY